MVKLSIYKCGDFPHGAVGDVIWENLRDTLDVYCTTLHAAVEKGRDVYVIESVGKVGTFIDILEAIEGFGITVDLNCHEPETSSGIYLGQKHGLPTPLINHIEVHEFVNLTATKAHLLITESTIVQNANGTMTLRTMKTNGQCFDDVAAAAQYEFEYHTAAFFDEAIGGNVLSCSFQIYDLCGGGLFTIVPVPGGRRRTRRPMMRAKVGPKSRSRSRSRSKPRNLHWYTSAPREPLFCSRC